MRKRIKASMAHYDTDFTYCTKYLCYKPKGKCVVCRYRKKCDDKGE